MEKVDEKMKTVECDTYKNGAFVKILANGGYRMMIECLEKKDIFYYCGVPVSNAGTKIPTEIVQPEDLINLAIALNVVSVSEIFYKSPTYIVPEIKFSMDCTGFSNPIRIQIAAQMAGCKENATISISSSHDIVFIQGYIGTNKNARTIIQIKANNVTDYRVLRQYATIGYADIGVAQKLLTAFEKIAGEYESPSEFSSLIIRRNTSIQYPASPME
jgi:hypothetical protein